MKYSYNFQDSGTYVMNELKNLHDHVTYYLVTYLKSNSF